MDTGLIIAIIVAAFAVAVLTGIVARQRREKQLQGKRVEAADQRDQARVEAAQAKREQALAQERAAKAKQEEAAAQEHAARAEQARRSAGAREEHAGAVDPDG